METKAYDDVLIRKEDDTVVLTNAFSQLRMKWDTFRSIVADNTRRVMKGNDGNVTVHHETGTYPESY